MSVMDSKAAGNAAFKTGDMEEAVKCYTEAIGDDPSDKVLFSNRSAAHSKLGQFKEALLDANKCISLDAAWAKGHSRRGAAYMGLRSWRAALGAFEEGLKLEPDNKYMLEEAERMRKILEGGNAPSASSAGPPPPASAPAGASNRLHGVISFNILLFTFFYVVPLFPRHSAMAYKASAAFAMALFAVNLKAQWPIAMATLKNAAFYRSEEMQSMLLCLMMIVSPPLPFAIMPFAAVAVQNVCRAYAPLIQKLPGFVSQRAAFLLTEEGGQMVHAFAAVSEVVVCFMSPLVILAQGFRVAVVLFFYLQHIARRYESNFWTKQAVSQLTLKLDGFFSHRWCPAPVGMIYTRVKGVVGLAINKIKSF